MHSSPMRMSQFSPAPWLTLHVDLNRWATRRMSTAPGCALIVTAPLSVQAELADRPNPPTRPLPADPVVRRPKVTWGGREGHSLSPTQGCGAGGKTPSVPEATYPSGIFNGDRLVWRPR